MAKDIFEARRVAFETEYFHKKDAQLVEKLKQVFHRKRAKEELREATGITDEAVLDTLIDLHLNGNLLAAFQLYPLIDIAWADGGVDEHERNAVLEAARQHGIEVDSPAFALLERGLRKKTSSEMQKAWRLYAGELRKILTPSELATFREDLVSYAKQVAAASGGLLNVAFTTGAGEKTVLEVIESTLAVGS